MFGFSVHRICCCARSETHCIHVHGRSLRTRRGDERNACGKGGTEGEEIYDPPCTTPAVARFSFFCFALVTDSLALRYNHLEGYETILVARSDNLSRVSLQFYFASLASFFLLECNLPFILHTI